MTGDISVIVPVHDERGALERTLDAARTGRDVDLIVVDGGSVDGGPDVARRSGARVIEAPRCRATQMNAGARIATGRVLLFLHADTCLPAAYDSVALDVLDRPEAVAGAFALSIDAPGMSLRLIERVANWRARQLQMPYGDQAIFLEADRFRRLGGYPELPFMEDFELVRSLRRSGRIEIAAECVSTSARRWAELGVFRATLFNQLAVAGYLAGVEPQRLAAWYRRGRDS